MSKVNIYPTIVFDLHPRIKGYIDQLQSSGQIDTDDNGHPYLLNVDKNPPNFICKISRDNKEENFIINTRNQRPPIVSWNVNDGWRNPNKSRNIVMTTTGNEEKRGERKLRTTNEVYKKMVEQMIVME